MIDFKKLFSYSKWTRNKEIKNNKNEKGHLFFGISNVQHLVHIILLLISLYLISEPAIEFDILFIKLTAKFFKALGEAGLIALAVVYLVEAQSHKRLEETAEKMISKIGRGIFGLIYGHQLPDELIRSLEEKTLSQPVYRESVELMYMLKSVVVVDKNGANMKLCELQNTHSSILKNCSPKQEKTEVTVFLERDKYLIDYTDAASEPVIYYVEVDDKIYYSLNEKLKIEGMRGKIKSDMQEIEIYDFLEKTDDDNKLTFNIKDVAIPAKGMIKIRYAGMLHKRDSDNEFWKTKYTTLNSKLQITTTDYDLNVDFPFAQELTPIANGDFGSCWEYDQVLLKGHSVTFWWLPKATK